MKKHFGTMASLFVVAGLITHVPVWAQQQGDPGGTASIYGVLDEYVGSMRRSDQTARTTSLNSGGLTTSYYGFRGSEDLGGGTRTLFALESFFQMNSGAVGRTAADPFFSRNAFVGLSNGYGALMLGRQTNPMFVATGNFNPFGLSANLAPSMLQVWSSNYNRTVLGDSVWDNTVQYTTPSIAGLTAATTYGFGAVANNVGVRNLNLTINYASGPFAAVVSGQQVKYGAGIVAPIGSEKAVMAGLSYDLKVVKIFGEYFDTKTPDVSLKTKTGQLGVSAHLAGGTVMASVANTQRNAPAVSTSRITAAMGYDYFLSKRTDLYTAYLSDKLSGFSRQGSLTFGVRHRF